ncbi:MULTISPECIES: translation initiation factor [Helicobacter]|uniref:Translation initiation factor n=1 Tax=Helicobacter ibis TaxID=2962633 RepID=A0ABT4VD13_9HELI|nr:MULTISPECIES: translation initiation factor [Helicobacter]MDA3967334.1 translation initiation factor [Helicobacter sp. WB40]MDA3968597.1 translation initiation factor [Helicobacter ibis]
MDRLKIQIGAKFSDEISCKKCGEIKCICNKQEEYIKSKHSYTIWANAQKNGGKDIVVCGIFYENKESLEVILKDIKKKLATGGCIKEQKDGYILELQGKNVDKIKEILKNNKFKFKN